MVVQLTSIDDYSNGTYTNSNTVGSVTHTEVADSNTGMPIQISTSDTSADTESSVKALQTMVVNLDCYGSSESKW